MVSMSTLIGKEAWYTEKLIKGNNFHLVAPYACIVLNRQICIPSDVVKNLWQNAQIRLTVDGGTDRWHAFASAHFPGVDMKPPDYITGDFDSISHETLELYKSNERTKIVPTPDQNETDFTKSLRVLKPDVEEHNITNVLVFQDTSGRLDQVMANINTLFKVKTIFDREVKVFLLSGNSVSWLLSAGEHTIYVPEENVTSQSWCALIPIGCSAKATTSGLKWNLDDTRLEFGGMVSTSNTFSSATVQVRTDSPLLWSMRAYRDE